MLKLYLQSHVFIFELGQCIVKTNECIDNSVFDKMIKF